MINQIKDIIFEFYLILIRKHIIIYYLAFLYSINIHKIKNIQKC